MNYEEKMFTRRRGELGVKDKRFSGNGAKSAKVMECKAGYGDDREKIHHGDPEGAELKKI
ncbi:MAG TPA: hypothetical protein P5295_03315 [Spirochaetota bacterium]|nr:hypothetical protein [Spirochaetota bacterium]